MGDIDLKTIKNFRNTSLVCFIISILIWVPNLVFQITSPLLLLIFIVPFIGLAFAVLAKNYWLIIANLIMGFSFFILMAFGYYIGSKLN